MAVVSGSGSSCSGSGTAQDEEKDEEKVPAPHRAGSSQPRGGRRMVFLRKRKFEIRGKELLKGVVIKCREI